MSHTVITKTPLQIPLQHHLPQSHQTHPTKARHTHLTTTQNPTKLNTIPTAMIPSIRPCPSNASLTSTRATFLIFLCRCHRPLSPFPLPFPLFFPSSPSPVLSSSHPSFGATASL